VTDGFALARVQMFVLKHFYVSVTAGETSPIVVSGTIKCPSLQQNLLPARLCLDDYDAERQPAMVEWDVTEIEKRFGTY
jgi:hypothetical protein